MVQAYWREALHDEAVFSLFVRRLPDERAFLLACGLDDALRFLEDLRFHPETLDYLASRPEFEQPFVDWLADLRFRGEVRAMPEGTPLFANEPILEVRASLPQAQLAETILMNQVQLQTMLASKAARVVLAARGRAVVDFGLRRMHGVDAGLKAARAFHIAGVAATSNVLAGKIYGIPVTGTMAHSYVQAHASELDAFRAFARQYPETTLLVDTYDTLEGVRTVVRLAEELGDDFAVSAVRLDSGDLAALAIQARRILDDAGLAAVRIFASGGLDEDEIEALLTREAPIDGFGVGTSMGVSSDAPALDIAYKLAEYAGRARLKLSSDKPIQPGSKQVFRVEEAGVAVRDIIARADESLPGRPLLEPVMRRGRRLPAGKVELEAARAYAAERIASLPDRLRGIGPPEPAYPVEVSPRLRELQRTTALEVAGSVDAQ
ncbi:MAG: nicotinate phosphoribosyltransferase [Longimicrobiales bacterium]